MKSGDELFKELLAEAQKVIYMSVAIRLGEIFTSENFIEIMGLRPLRGYLEFLKKCQPDFIVGNAFAPGFSIKAGFTGWKMDSASLLSGLKGRVDSFKN
jgi:hypothetical protein